MRLALRVLAWNAGFLVLVIVVAELVFGGWLDSIQRPNLWRLSIFRNVHWTMTIGNAYPREGPIEYRRDRYGLRGQFDSPDQVTILAVGGSATDERFVTEGETWTDVLGACLRASGRKAWVANAGVSGQSSRGHIENFNYWLNHIPGLQPRYVVAYLGANERYLDQRVNNDDPRIYNEAKYPLWLQRLKLNSALYGFYRLAHGNITAYRAGIHTLQVNSHGETEYMHSHIDRKFRLQNLESISFGSPEYQRRLTEAKKAWRDHLVAYRMRLGALKKAISDFGAQPIFVTQPISPYRIIGNRVIGDLDAFFDIQVINDTTLEFCTESNILCIDLAGTLPVSDGDFYDGVHTTASGSGKIGRFLCERLLELPLPSLLMK